METIAAGVFKAKCLAIMDEVRLKRRPVVITKNGKPVAKLVPIEEEDADPIFGFFAGKVMSIADDIDTPTIPSDDWNRLK